MGSIVLELSLLLAVLAVPALVLGLVFRSELRSLRLAGAPFACSRCGACCRFQVRLTRADVARLVASGLREEEFAVRFLGLKFLRKRADGVCVHLRAEGGQAACQVYDARPEICRRFPALRLLGLPAKDCRCPAARPKAP